MKSTIISTAICAAVLSISSAANAGYNATESSHWKDGAVTHHKHGASEAARANHPKYKYKWKKKGNKWHAKRGKWHKKRSKMHSKRKQWREHGYGKKPYYRTSKPYKPHQPYGWVKRARKY